MLTALRIRNFALIDELSVRLGPGFNVLTGETGAGKSIVVGALSLLLGERASSDQVREGTERASVEGVFEIEARPELLAWLDSHGMEAGDGLLILKREVAAEGRSRAWVNGSPTTASLLGEIGRWFVSLHGQHEHQTLLKREEQRVILDAFAGARDAAVAVAEAHAALRDVAERIRELEERRRQTLQRADYLRFQLDEIDSAGLAVDEEARLGEEARRLSHAEELIGLAGSLVATIASDRDSLTDRLGSLRRAVDQLVRIDPSQSELAELFDTSYYALEEMAGRLERYLLVVEHDPERLETIRQRQDLLFRLKRKYGPEVEDVLRTGAEARAELALLETAEFELGELERQRAQRAEALASRAAELSSMRREAAYALAGEVERILPELGMEGGRFEAVLVPLPAVGAEGTEEVEFRVSLNRGFEPRPLAHVASGGELSRVMLALKTILARLDAVPTLIFDEVDAGIGGRVALHVGDKLRDVAASHQVLAITHLPQIASRAHRHLLVQKEADAGRTTTTVRELDETQRSTEIARMLGGDPESEASLNHARELLERGRRTTAPVGS